MNQGDPEAKSITEHKMYKKDIAMDLSSPLPNYTVTEVNNGFRKKEPILYFAANEDRGQGKT